MNRRHHHTDRGYRHGPGPWGPPFGRRGHYRGGGRARRGDVRAAILALLSERPMHGYEIIQELGERTGGVWQPSPGSVYPTLQMLEDEGLISGEEIEGRRRFTLTETGKAEAERRQSERTPWQEVTAGADPSAMDVRRSFAQIFGAVRQIAETGTEEQMSKVVQVLHEARKNLYAILAEDE
jgi:DNA-binding PadR family transcriptional regulator